MSRPVPVCSVVLCCLVAGAARGQQASFKVFGSGCKGTGGAQYQVVVPARSGSGGNVSFAAFAAPSRVQQVVSRADLGRVARLESVWLRAPASAVSPARTIELMMLLAETAAAPDRLSTTFASNYLAGRPPTVVIPRTRLHLPRLAPPRNGEFSLTLRLQTPFTTSRTHNLLVELRTFTSTSTQPYLVDTRRKRGDGASMVVAKGATAAVGTATTDGMLLNLYGIVAGGAVPKLGGTPPKLGGVQALWVTEALRGARAALLVGTRIRPLDLTLSGMPGCTLYTAGQVAFPNAISTSGSTKWGIGIPNVSALAGLELISQWGILDRKANLLGVVASAAGAGIIGR